MNGFYLAWRNLKDRPLRMTFNLLLIGLATGLIAISLLVNLQFKNHFEKNLAGVDLILSAKGSPLQSVLCNMFHIDAPTGNIPLSETKAFLNPAHPLIKKALPLCLGDQVGGFRIAGTTLEFLDWYQLSFREGNAFKGDFEAIVGSEAAKGLELKTGSVFQSGHGLVDDPEHAHEHEFKVSGILNPSGTVADRLVLVSASSYWALHHDEQAENHADHHHGPPCIRNADLLNTKDQITSLLLEFKGTNIQTLNFGRSINENTGLMASYPAIELNRMYELTGSATELFSLIAGLLIILAALSLFISMWQAMDERQYETAILRLGGATRWRILYWVLLEGFLLSAIGVLLGLAAAHAVLILVAEPFALQQKYGIGGWVFFREEIWILVLGIALGLLSAWIPAMKALRGDIHRTLTT
ncbi:MAG TPA: FtsX-like permease family protein, partial [Saprospiraceae bacterium]|nr:FtsX-like permease family protein [Saprospiraceae bacterium]